MGKQKDRRKELGRWGEDVACRYLLQQGYRLLEKNFRTKKGEIDLIMYRDSFFVFVEVKTRKGDLFGDGREAITVQKQKRIRTVALQYLKTRPVSTGKIRFDVVIITCDKNFLPHISHIENAF